MLGTTILGKPPYIFTLYTLWHLCLYSILSSIYSLPEDIGFIKNTTNKASFQNKTSTFEKQPPKQNISLQTGVYIVYIYTHIYIYIDTPPPTFPQASTVRWGTSPLVASHDAAMRGIQRFWLSRAHLVGGRAGAES